MSRPEDSDISRDPDRIAGLLAGDPETIETIRDWVRLSLLTYRDLLGAEAEDMEQETLLNLTEILREGRFKGDSKLRTFVRSLAHHKAIDRVRAKTRRKFLDVADLDLKEARRSPVEEIASEQNIALALEVQERMPDTCRELWQMILQGKSYREMSRQFGVAEATLRLRVHRCRQKARKLRASLLARSGSKKR